jgi:hypothetical protein
MRACLLGEGSSDRALVQPLRWLLGQLTPADHAVDWIDTSRLNKPKGLAARIQAALAVAPCDLLFVHRDADKEGPEPRRSEIAEAVAGRIPHVAVIPVRTMEAWLLIDETALRWAAGRPSGREPLELPPLARLEGLAAPKELLSQVLRTAHGGKGRRAAHFDESVARKRLADLIEDWSPLLTLPAFQRLEADTRSALQTLGLPLRG